MVHFSEWDEHGPLPPTNRLYILLLHNPTNRALRIHRLSAFLIRIDFVEGRRRNTLMLPPDLPQLLEPLKRRILPEFKQIIHGLLPFHGADDTGRC